MHMADIGDKPVNLNDDEVIVWRGRPAQGIIRNLTHIGWGLALLALGFWLSIRAAGAAMGLPLMLAGAYLAYFHAIVEKNRRAATFYALTNQRAILAYSLRVLAYPILPNVNIKLKKGRYDTVLLSDDRKNGDWHGARTSGVGFGHLKSGDEVYNLMLDIQQKKTDAKHDESKL